MSPSDIDLHVRLKKATDRCTRCGRAHRTARRRPGLCGICQLTEGGGVRATARGRRPSSPRPSGFSAPPVSAPAPTASSAPSLSAPPRRRVARANPSRAADRDSDLAGLEPHVSLTEAVRLLGVARQTLLNRLHEGKAQDLRAVKVWGRWKVPVSAIRALLRPEPPNTGGPT